MEHVIHSLTGAFAGFGIADVAINLAETFPLFRSHQMPDFFEVAMKAGGVVVKSGDVLTETKKCLQQIGADKPSRAGNEPNLWLGLQLAIQVLICGHGLIQVTIQ